MDGAALRAEVVESQKFVVDLERWKLILVAALGAAALGLGPGSGEGPQRSDRELEILLALIPLVCVYVDVLVYHNGLRILVISHFLQGPGHGDGFARSYERFCGEKRKFFFLETYALLATTLFLSVAVFVLAFRVDMARAIRFLVGASGAVGVVAGTVVLVVYERLVDKLEAARSGETSSRTLHPVLWMIVAAAVGGLAVWLTAPNGGEEGRAREAARPVEPAGLDRSGP